MALEVGTLRIDVEVGLKKFNAAFKKIDSTVERFSKRTNKQLDKLGKKFKSLGPKVAKFGKRLALVVGVAGAVAFVKLGRGAIQAASDIDTFEIRLQNLIGSQRIANETIAEIGVFAQKVAPSFRDLIESTATLGTVALGSADDMIELTKTATNIAAVSGLTLQQSSQNLQRTLSAGIGAADLFRERGIRAVVEALTGVPNLIEVPLNEVRKLILQVFGPDGDFKDVATQFATTLPGSISVAGDALFQFEAALGEAFTPAIIGFIKEALIPALDGLRDSVIENRGEISTFATAGIKFAVEGLITLSRVLINVVELLSNLHLALIGAESAALTLAKTAVLAAPVIGFLGGAAAGAAAAGQTGALVGGVAGAFAGIKASTDLMEGITNAAEGSVIAFEKATAEQLKFSEGLDGIRAGIAAIEGGLDDFGEEAVAKALEAAAKGQAELQKLQNKFADRAVRIDPRVAAQVKSAEERARRLIDKRLIASQKITSTTQARITALGLEAKKIQETFDKTSAIVDAQKADRQDRIDGLAEFDEAAKTSERSQASLTERRKVLVRGIRAAELNVNESVRARSGLLADNLRAQELISDEVARLDKILQALPGRIDELEIQVVTDLLALEQLDAEVAQRMEKAFILGIKNATTDEEILKALERFALALENKTTDALEKAAPDLAGTIGGALTDGISSAFDDLATTGAVDFAKILGDLSAEFMDQALGKSLELLGTKINDILKKTRFGDPDSLGGSALSGALSIGAGLLAGALRDNSIDVSNDKIESAVDSSRAVRGVVAGPQEIAIFQVSNAIRDAFVETNDILLTGNAILRQIRDTGAAGGGGNVTLELDQGPQLG